MLIIKIWGQVDVIEKGWLIDDHMGLLVSNINWGLPQSMNNQPVNARHMAY